MMRRWTSSRGRPNRPTDLLDLAAILLAVVASCSYLLAAVLGVLWWTNHYPEWSNDSVVLWYGIVGAAVAWRLLRARQGR